MWSLTAGGVDGDDPMTSHKKQLAATNVVDALTCTCRLTRASSLVVASSRPCEAEKHHLSQLKINFHSTHSASISTSPSSIRHLCHCLRSAVLSEKQLLIYYLLLPAARSTPNMTMTSSNSPSAGDKHKLDDSGNSRPEKAQKADSKVQTTLDDTVTRQVPCAFSCTSACHLDADRLPRH